MTLEVDYLYNHELYESAVFREGRVECAVGISVSVRYISVCVSA